MLEHAPSSYYIKVKLHETIKVANCYFKSVIIDIISLHIIHMKVIDKMLFISVERLQL